MFQSLGRRGSIVGPIDRVGRPLVGTVHGAFRSPVLAARQRTLTTGQERLRPSCVAALAWALVASLFPATGHGQTKVPHEVASLKIIAPIELQAMLDSGEVFVFDCNEEYVFEEMHVPGAVPIVYDEFSAADLPEERNAAVVFYCYSPDCPAGELAAGSALRMGYTNVLCMVQGIIGWQDAGLRTEP